MAVIFGSRSAVAPEREAAENTANLARKPRWPVIFAQLKSPADARTDNTARLRFFSKNLRILRISAVFRQPIPRRKRRDTKAAA